MLDRGLVGEILAVARIGAEEMLVDQAAAAGPCGSMSAKLSRISAMSSSCVHVHSAPPDAFPALACASPRRRRSRRTARTRPAYPSFPLTSPQPCHSLGELTGPLGVAFTARGSCSGTGAIPRRPQSVHSVYSVLVDRRSAENLQKQVKRRQYNRHAECHRDEHRVHTLRRRGGLLRGDSVHWRRTSENVGVLRGDPSADDGGHRRCGGSAGQNVMFPP